MNTIFALLPVVDKEGKLLCLESVCVKFECMDCILEVNI